jgi:hypothetical protein
LQIRADWRHLNTKPVRLVISDILVVVKPRTNLALDPIKEEQRIMDAKLAQLQKATDACIDAANARAGSHGGKGGEKKKSKSGWKSRLKGLRNKIKKVQTPDEDNTFSDKMAAKILDNIHITAERVHIRYETSDPVQPVALGVTLAKLAVFTTDAMWRESFVTGASQVFKQVALDRLAVYANVHPSRGARPITSLKELAEVFIPQGSGNRPDTGDTHLLRSVSGHLNMTINKDPDASPRYCLAGRINSVDLRLGDTQYRGLSASAMSLWQSQAVLQAQVTALRERLKGQRAGTDERSKYMALFKRRLKGSKGGLPTAEDAGILDDLERVLILSDVVAFREAVITEAGHKQGIVAFRGPKDKADDPEKKKKKRSFFGRKGKDKGDKNEGKGEAASALTVKAEASVSAELPEDESEDEGEDEGEGTEGMLPSFKQVATAVLMCS